MYKISNDSNEKENENEKDNENEQKQDLIGKDKDISIENNEFHNKFNKMEEKISLIYSNLRKILLNDEKRL